LTNIAHVTFVHHGQWTCYLCAPKHAMHKNVMSRVISSFWHLFPIRPWWIRMLM